MWQTWSYLGRELTNSIAIHYTDRIVSRRYSPCNAKLFRNCGISPARSQCDHPARDTQFGALGSADATTLRGLDTWMARACRYQPMARVEMNMWSARRAMS